MKISLTFKDPDGVANSLKDAVVDSLSDMKDSLSKREFDQLVEIRMEEAGNSLSKWVEYSEYITVEIDTDNGTATVKPVR